MIIQLNLEEYKKVLVRNLSGGTRKRVDVACALIKDPEIVVLDEPFLGLDPALVGSLSKLIAALKKSGKTIIISSHRARELSDICTRIVLLRSGQLFSIKKNQLGRVYF